jgi:2-methylisocitrate lyase-like PEP mutase family enzyme
VDQVARAELLRSLHTPGAPVVLVNAWDAGSATVMAEAGAPAIATTSAGVSWSLGRPDGQHLTRAEMVEVVRRIAAAVGVPVSADVEGGYGPAPDDVAATTAAVVAAGAVGINLEDSIAGDGGLFDVEAQTARLAAARTAAAGAGLPGLVVNARTDVYLFEIGAPGERFDEVCRRGRAYRDAGADCLFVPGLLDPVTLKALVAESALPISVMAAPGGPSVAELAATGVSRISVGTAVAQAAYAVARGATRELLADGTLTALAGASDVDGLDALFARHR